MEKKSKKEKLIAELISDYDIWDRQYREGAGDPFYTDGDNLNLKRNHIIYDKRQIEENLSEDEYPQEYYRELPPELPHDYMAKAEEIRRKAAELLKAARASPDAQYLLQNSQESKIPKDISQSVKIAVNRLKALERDIVTDDLVELRMFIKSDGPQYWKEIADRLRTEIEKKQSREMPLGQLSIFDFISM